MSRHHASLILLAALAVAVPCPGGGTALAERLQGPIEAEVLRVVDGDTVEVRARIWLGQTVTTLVRVNGIDTPERRSRCDAEKKAAEKVTALVADLLPVGGKIRLRDVETGKYAGRVVAGVEMPDGRDLARLLLDRKLARPYDGGSRAGWCD
ncbi:thermonuclease family protein [Novispirillum sp. DQ9]|uniref:thermonuclease family protein n=1 Tax=Novispirillum sp. DQ9 TaxID=3398612 RepID=UPI003C7D511E